MAAKFLIVPGLNGSADGHWQQWWLRDHDNAVLVEQDNWAVPDPDAWLANLVAAIDTHPNSVLVGHSLGSVLIGRLADHPIAALVRAALLVAPADIERTRALHSRPFAFGVMPERKLPFPARLVASRDDIYMTFQRTLTLGRSWQCEVVDLGYVGHINIASGYGRWQEGYRLAAAIGTEVPLKAVTTR